MWRGDPPGRTDRHYGVSAADYTDEAALADAIVAGSLSRYGDAMRTGFDAEGVDVHVAPNGDIYAFYATC